MVKGIAVLSGLVGSVLLAASLAILAPAAAVEAPTLDVPPTLEIPYKSALWIWGHRANPSDTIRVETRDGRELTCEDEVGPSDLRYFECTVNDFYTDPDQAGLSETIVVNELDRQENLVSSAEIVVTFEHSLFRRSDAPPHTPGSDSIIIAGETEEDPSLSIVWTLDKNGQLLAEDACEDWFDDSDETYYFKCEYTDTSPAGVAASSSTRGASNVTNAALVLPAAISNGSYTATVEEYRNGTQLLDTMVYSFNVGTSTPPDTTPDTPDAPTTPQTPTYVPLALAPIIEREVISDDTTPDEEDTAAPSVQEIEQLPAPPPQDDKVLTTLLLAMTGMTLLAFVGPRGLAHPRRLSQLTPAAAGAHSSGDVTSATASAVGGGGELAETDEDAGRSRPFGDAWGDKSFTWRFPGWPRMDAISTLVPARLSATLPLAARGLVDAAYLRAALGVVWLAVPLAGIILGFAAASGDSALSPAWIVAAILLVIAVLDATAGLVAVTAFAVVTLSSGGLTAGGLSLSPGLRGLLGLAALWFVTPLIAAAARPVRRPREPGKVYGWDRLGDTVIAALISGWAVQGIVSSLPDLTGRDLAIADRADTLALTAIGAVMLRFLLEELVATGYPRRLAATDPESLMREPSTFHAVRGVLIRAGLLAFFAGAVIGNCWQLWAGVAIFTAPQLLDLLGLKPSRLAALGQISPRGVLQIFVLVLAGAAIAYQIEAGPGDVRIEALRAGFVLLAIPGALLELLSTLGETPEESRWTWPRQLAGAALVAATVASVLAFG